MMPIINLKTALAISALLSYGNGISHQCSAITRSAFVNFFKEGSTCPRFVTRDCSGELQFENGISTVLIENKYDRNMTTFNGIYRPRSALARAIYEKEVNDMKLRQIDKTEWYRVDKERLDTVLASKFVQLSPDNETKRFLADSTDKSSWVWTQLWHMLARLLLKYFWTATDINGWLGRGSMFVLSEPQLRALCGDRLAGPRASAGPGAPAARRLVDLGAGDGEVTRRWRAHFPDMYATEVSASMRKRLAAKGYTLLDADSWWRAGLQFDCVSMLNLLDRCSRPRSMLQQARSALAPGGILLVALVLPYTPYVEVNNTHKPEETLPVRGAHFEESVASFVSFMREEIRMELISWARVPYLSEGDVNQAYYWLDDSIYAFAAIES